MRTLHVVVCASSEDCKVSVQFSRHRDVIFLYEKRNYFMRSRLQAVSSPAPLVPERSCIGQVHAWESTSRVSGEAQLLPTPTA